MTPPLSQQLARHLVDWRALPWPPAWSELFGREAPLCVEIGFGNGAFLAHQSALHPERDHLGIELSWSAARRLLPRLDKAGVENARALLIDAKLALLHLFEPGSLDEVFANHPCPWPKARHAERRLFTPDFLDLLTSRMKPGAKLTIVTDHAEYAEWVGGELEAHPAIASCHATTEIDDLPGHLPTKYQVKAMAEGIPIHYFEWRKVSDALREGPLPLPHRDRGARVHKTDETDGDTSMPTITLRGDYDRGTLFGDALPTTVQETAEGLPVVCRLEAPFRREDPAMWLVECFVTEGKLRQEFAILVIERRSNELFLKLAGLGRPHPTYGVRRAVALLGKLLREREPGLAVVHENLGADALEGAGSGVPC